MALEGAIKGMITTSTFYSFRGTGLLFFYTTQCQFTEATSGVDSGQLDLLLSAQQQMAAKPFATFDADCFSAQAFTLHRSSDDANLLTTFPNFITESADSFNVVLPDDPSVFTVR